jgi:hypothetical protein
MQINYSSDDYELTLLQKKPCIMAIEVKPAIINTSHNRILAQNNS